MGVPSLIVSNGPGVAIDAAHIGDSRDPALLNDPGVFPNDLLRGVQVLEGDSRLHSADILPVLDLGLVAIDRNDNLADLSGAKTNDNRLGLPRRLWPTREQMFLQLLLGWLKLCDCIVRELLLARISIDRPRDERDLRRRKGIERVSHVVFQESKSPAT